jgi:hypothetical protein
MSIIQISKIQQRAGDLVDLPQLDEAEFGFASDVKRLFIGKTTDNIENIEVLTAYSEISFDQIEGVTGNIDIDSASLANGQVLAYDGNTWVNKGGNAGGLITLGNASNVTIEGGAIGYTLTTDGGGNLSWTPKGVVALDIQSISASSAAVLTLANPFPFPNVQVTINGIGPGNYASNLNAVDFYIDPVPGNLQLYDLYWAANGLAVNTASYGSYPANTGTLIFNTVTSTGNSVGVAGSVQYSDGAGGFVATTGFTFTAGSGLDIPGNVVVTSNVFANSGTVRGSLLTGTLTTAAQPNVTSVGTLTSLAVTGNITSGNVFANSGTVRGNLLTGTLTTAAQPNITSVGTLTSLAVTGNITTGNVFANSGTVRATTLQGTVLTTGANTTAGTVTGNWSLSAGSRLNATYADLAEYYCADQKYESGTVLQFGGKEEVTLAQENTNKIAGIVTTNPAYVMNTTLECEHNAVMIALAGRVPCKVIGPVFKGDMLISAGNGYAKVATTTPIMGTVIGKAIQSIPSHDHAVIEVMVGRL